MNPVFLKVMEQVLRGFAVVLATTEDGKEVRGRELSLEHHLLNNANWWQKFRAWLYGGRGVFLGNFMPYNGKAIGQLEYYIFWCCDCEKLQVAYRQGKRSLPCSLCNDRDVV